MARQQDDGDRFAALARSLRNQTGETDTIDQALKLAVDFIDGCDEAAISLIRAGGRIDTPDATGQRARDAAQLQYALGEGPCLTTARDEQTTLCRNLAAEQRWPNWARRVHQDMGFGSVLCFQLFTTGDDYGALNMYSNTVDAFDDHDLSVGMAMAAHIAVALAASRQIDQLHRSIRTRNVVGQAMGILMERYELDAEGAFQFLIRVSSNSNTKLIVVAEHLAATRQLPASGS